jgi:hypothetical protein
MKWSTSKSRRYLAIFSTGVLDLEWEYIEDWTLPSKSTIDGLAGSQGEVFTAARFGVSVVFVRALRLAGGAFCNVHGPTLHTRHKLPPLCVPCDNRRRAGRRAAVSAKTPVRQRDSRAR